MHQPRYLITTEVLDAVFQIGQKERQRDYYQAIQRSTAKGESSPFIIFMLAAISETLARMLATYERPAEERNRLLAFRAFLAEETFSRKDYRNYHKTISSATASRDLQDGVAEGHLERIGNNRTTRYRFR